MYLAITNTHKAAVHNNVWSEDPFHVHIHCVTQLVHTAIKTAENAFVERTENVPHFDIILALKIVTFCQKLC